MQLYKVDLQGAARRQQHRWQGDARSACWSVPSEVCSRSSVSGGMVGSSSAFILYALRPDLGCMPGAGGSGLAVVVVGGGGGRVALSGQGRK